jgi:toxin ParE1/3/4
LIHLAAYIAARNEDAAGRFILAVFASFRILASHPEIGRRRTFSGSIFEGLRSWNVPDFRNHLIFYRVINGTVENVRIAHGAMDLDVIFGETEPDNE